MFFFSEKCSKAVKRVLKSSHLLWGYTSKVKKILEVLFIIYVFTSQKRHSLNQICIVREKNVRFDLKLSIKKKPMFILKVPINACWQKKTVSTAYKDLYQVQETWKFFFLTHIQLCVPIAYFGSPKVLTDGST